MHETIWLSSSDPHKMIELVQRRKGQLASRGLRLFACALARRLWHFLDEPSRQAIEVAEQHADGLVSDMKLRAANKSMSEATSYIDFADYSFSPELPEEVATLVASAGTSMKWLSVSASNAAHWINENAVAVDILRDIFGNPFRPPPPINLSLLTPAIVALAGDIYQQRAFERLPELAAALETQGCQDSELLGHLRGPGPHVRGCWALDAILGKS